LQNFRQTPEAILQEVHATLFLSNLESVITASLTFMRLIKWQWGVVLGLYKEAPLVLSLGSA